MASRHPREIAEWGRQGDVGTGEPFGKAGAYAIQGLAAAFIERIEGSYSAVMGLPLYETAELLRAAGIEIMACDPPRHIYSRNEVLGGLRAPQIYRFPPFFDRSRMAPDLGCI